MLIRRDSDALNFTRAVNHDGYPEIMVIRRHPWSQRKAICVNPMFTESIPGLTGEESEAILSLLYRHCIRPEFILRLRWQPGTIVIWDNLTTMHCPLNDYLGHRRVMHRIVIAGDVRSGYSVS